MLYTWGNQGMGKATDLFNILWNSSRAVNRFEECWHLISFATHRTWSPKAGKQTYKRASAPTANNSNCWMISEDENQAARLTCQNGSWALGNLALVVNAKHFWKSGQGFFLNSLVSVLQFAGDAVVKFNPLDGTSRGEGQRERQFLGLGSSFNSSEHFASQAPNCPGRKGWTFERNLIASSSPFTDFRRDVLAPCYIRWLLSSSAY